MLVWRYSCRDTECPVGERYSEITLEAVAYNAIGQFLMLAEKQAVQNREVGNLRKTAIKECADNIRALQMQSEQLKGVKLRLYEKYTSGSITRDEYLRQKTVTDAKIAENEEAIRRGHERMQELDSEQSCSDERLDAVCKESVRGDDDAVTLFIQFAHDLFEILTDDQVMSSWASSVNGDVLQGDTDRYAYTPINGQQFEVSLTWDRAASGNYLALYIYPPDSNSIKIHDNTDGKFDGKISLRTVISTDDLNQLWIFGVTGDQVSGTQSSTLTINSY